MVAAVTGDRPAVIPAWAYGFDGAGGSFGASPIPRSIARSIPVAPAVANLRAGDRVALRFATDGPHPDNPFEHRAGGPFRADERIVVDLAPGEWLVFDVGDETDAAEYTPLGPDREPVPATIERVARGIRVTAEAPHDTRLDRRRWRRVPVGSVGRS